MSDDEDRKLTDDDWAGLRDAVPAFAKPWARVVAADGYDPTLPYVNLGEIAQFVADEMLIQRPDELPAIGEAIDDFLARLWLRGDERVTGLITVAFLETLIRIAEEEGVPLLRLRPLLTGPHIDSAWERALAWMMPGFVWDHETATVVPAEPLPSPVGTARTHRAWTDPAEGVGHIDLRLLSGTIAVGNYLRHEIGKHHWSSYRIDTLALRSPDLPNEYHVTTRLAREEAFSVFAHFLAEEWHWQVVEASATSDDDDRVRPGL